MIIITLAEVGGAQSHVTALLPALTGHFDVTVAAHGPGPLGEAACAVGANFVPLHHVRRSLHPWHDTLGMLELIRLVRRLRPDIVHTHSSKAGVLGRIAAAVTGVPARLFTAHGWAFAAHDGLSARLYLWADRLTARLTTVVVCVSERERIEGLRARTCRDGQTVVIHNAVDVQTAPRAMPTGMPPEVISVGRFKAPKDPLTLVHALGQLAPGSFRATIVGDGPDRGAVVAALAQAGLEPAVRLVGERLDVPDLLARADVFVLTSLSEGEPISLLEAMATGLPVVASDVGGIPEVVLDGETGFLIPPGDPDALADALRRLLIDSELRGRLGRAGRARARELFDLLRFRDDHLRLYRAVIDPRNHGSRSPPTFRPTRGQH